MCWCCLTTKCKSIQHSYKIFFSVFVFWIRSWNSESISCYEQADSNWIHGPNEDYRETAKKSKKMIELISSNPKKEAKVNNEAKADTKTDLGLIVNMC